MLRAPSCDNTVFHILIWPTARFERLPVASNSQWPHIHIRPHSRLRSCSLFLNWPWLTLWTRQPRLESAYN